MPVMDGLEMGLEIKNYFDDFIKTFVNVKQNYIFKVNKKYNKIK